MAADPIIGFFVEAGRLLQNYEDTKARRHEDRAAFDRASTELHDFRKAMRELAQAGAGDRPDGAVDAGLAAVTAEGK